MLIQAALFLGAAVLFVPLFRRLGLGAVLGYLAGGIFIGPHALALVRDVESILHASEFGVVLLLFVIGLELQPARLWTLRRAVFGRGGAQVVATTAVLALGAAALGLGWGAALVAGFGLAMSSTALVLQMLAEKQELASHQGRAAFAILLFQDLAVLPAMALIPLLGNGMAGGPATTWVTVLKFVAVFALVIAGGRYLLRPVFRVIARSGVPEAFTAAALLTVVGAALAMEAIGLSMSLGAFLAGVLLADSEYRHELQADIEPFKGLLLGLFFIAVGMSANLALLLERPLEVLGLVAGLLVLKSLVVYAVGRVTGMQPGPSRALAVALSQGGEFAFVLFALAATAGILGAEVAALLVVVVTLSMIATPPLYTFLARFQPAPAGKPYDRMDDVPENPVIIAGFGPFGQIIGRILRVKRVPFTVLDKDSEQVDFVRRFGNRIFYGDAGRLDLLRAAHADKAKLFILAIPDIEASLHVAQMVRRHFPALRLLAMAVNRAHALRLMNLGVHRVIRRSYYSSLEMARHTLLELGENEWTVARTLEVFHQQDDATLRRQQAVQHDEQALIQSAKESAAELEQLFEADRPDSGERGPA